MKNLTRLHYEQLLAGHPAAKLGTFLLKHSNCLNYLETTLTAYLKAIRADREEAAETNVRLAEGLTQKKTNLYLVEYYRKNPTTGEGGWDIRFAWVKAISKVFAGAKVREADGLFDCVITMSEQSERFPLAGCDDPLVLE